MIFDHDLLQEIKSRADIVDVISSYINVIKKGRRYVSLCPFHDDHNPSMDINKDKQTYHCYVCGASGDVFNFVSEYEKISFPDAVKKVCEIINFDDPRLHKSETIKPIDTNIQTLYNCINELQKFYEYGLQTDEGKIARDYLAARKIDPEQASRFSVGYSLSDGKMAISYLQKKGFSLKNIEDIGIALARTQGMADNNAGRIIFPVKNANGQVVGFSARRLSDGDSSISKYVNSPETKIFRKTDILYNYHIAKQSCKHDGFIYVLEGFMDVFALDAIGIKSAVAIMGTALTEQHIKMLRFLGVEIRLCLDGDKPGQTAMMKIMSMLDKANISYRLVSMPGEVRDPDEILKQDGEDKLKTYINTLVDPFTFALNYYKNTSPIGSVDDRKKVVAHFAPMLANIKSKLELDDYIYKLSEVTQFNSNAIRNYVEEFKKNGNYVDAAERNEFNPVEIKKVTRKTASRLRLAERSMLELMVDHPEAIDFYQKNVKYFVDSTLRKLANFIVDYYAEHQMINISAIMDAISQSEESQENKHDLLKELNELTPTEIKDEDISRAMNDYLVAIQEEKTKSYNQNILDQLMDGKTAEEKARLLQDYIDKTNSKK